MTKMLALLNKLLTVLAALLGLYSAAKRKEEQQHVQQEKNDAQSNPTDWFAEHFNGVQQPASVPGDAAAANKANAEKSETK